MRHPEPALIPVPAPAVDADGLRQYLSLARDLDIRSPAIAQTAIHRVLSDHGVCLYDEAAVVRYLNREYGRPWMCLWLHPRWVWRPLRLRDTMIRPMSRCATNGVIVDQSTYPLPVPLPVLFKVRQLSSALSEYEPQFFVSDRWRPWDRMRRPLPMSHDDPFLLLVCGQRESQAMFRGVIERWDEPGFVLTHTRSNQPLAGE